MKFKKFADIMNSENGIGINETEQLTSIGAIVGHCHSLITEQSQKHISELLEIMLEMIVNGDFPSDYAVAISDLRSQIINEQCDNEYNWTLYDTLLLRENYPWCIDEEGEIIIEEVDEIGDDEEILNAASKKKLLKAARNPKSAKTYTTKKKFDKKAGLSKEQIKAGYVRCGPGTQAEGKIRKKGSCSKKTDPAVSRKMKQAAKQNVSSRRQAAKKAAKTRKKLAGRRRVE